MKQTLLYYALAFLSVYLFSCSNDQDVNSLLPDGMGLVNLNMESSTDIDIPIITKAKDLFADIDVNDFYVAITNREDHTSYKDFETYRELHETSPLIIPAGKYNVLASSFPKKDTKVSAQPYFVGDMNFIVENQRTSDVKFKCTYQSIGVELRISDQFKALLESNPKNYAYEVTVYNGDTSWKFLKDEEEEEMDPGYFLDACNKLKVEVRVRLNSHNSWYPTRTFYFDNNKGEGECLLGEYYIINLDAGAEERSAFSLTTLMKEIKE